MKRYRRLRLPGTAILLAALLNTYLFINAYVPSGSMVPTIPEGAMVLGNRMAYRKEEPKTGDVVFFHHAEMGEQQWLVKRVIALPGQTFAVKEGQVYINGSPLREPYVEYASKDNFPEICVPEDCYILLGDNRQASHDSRYWEDPFVRREDIRAKGWFVYFPKFLRL